MARIRTIKPEFFRHEKLQDLEAANPGAYVMLVFEGLWCMCDKNGVFENRPRHLKLDILPFLPFDMEATIVILEGAGFIKLYEVDGEKFGQVLKFAEHQRVSGKEAQDTSKRPLPHSDSKVVEPETVEGSNGEAMGKHLGSNRDVLGAQERSTEYRNGVQEQERSIGTEGGENLHSHILDASTLPSPYQPLTDIQVANIIRTFGLTEADRTQLDGELLRFQDFYTRNPSKSKNPNAYAALTKWLEKVTWRKQPKPSPPRSVASPGLTNPGWMEDEHGTA